MARNTANSYPPSLYVEQWFRKLHILPLVFLSISAPVLFGQATIPEWCRALPRPEYKALERVPVSDPWFEVYKVAPAVFAIYEPHQSEEYAWRSAVQTRRHL